MIPSIKAAAQRAHSGEWLVAITVEGVPRIMTITHKGDVVSVERDRKGYFG